MEINLYPSEVESFLRCGHRYYLTRIQGIKQKTTLALLVGRAFHKTIENDISYFLKEKKHLEIDAMLKTAEASLKIEMEQEIGNIELEKDKSLEQQYQEALNNLFGYINQYANILTLQIYEAIKTEENFELSIEDIKIIGRFDIITNKGFVEFKTKSRNLPKFYDPFTSLQNNLYLMAQKHLFNKKEALYIFVSPKSNAFFKTEYNKSIEDKTIKILKQIKKAIENEIFLPASQDESIWFCDYCGVKDYCEFILRKK
ncbi:MAG: PD-(D/E)XK nuclease family protein [Candidatus Micrarchaeia archaeon]